MLKRLFDFCAAFFGLFLLAPVLLLFMLLICLNDFHSPIYLAPRVKKNGKNFSMVKLRSMVVNAAKIGGVTTAGTDNRITWIGRIIRRYKLDELSQLWNVLIGDMSIVGPRPQSKTGGTDLYSKEELVLLNVRPGITDFASIVFSDEGEILSGHTNPDLGYNQLIRPWKSRLSLFYIYNQSFSLDIRLITITIIGIFSRPLALKKIQNLLKSLNAKESLIEIAGRRLKLEPVPPPGFEEVENRY